VLLLSSAVTAGYSGYLGGQPAPAPKACAAVPHGS